MGVPAPPVPVPFPPTPPFVPPVPPPPTQLPFAQVCPLPQTFVQDPQCALLVVTSTQVPLQSIWPAVEQAQTPATQLDPPVHAVQVLPQ